MAKVVDILVDGQLVIFKMKHGKHKWSEVHLPVEPLVPAVMTVDADGMVNALWMSLSTMTVYLPWGWQSTIPPHFVGEEPSDYAVDQEAVWSDWIAAWSTWLRPLPQGPLQHQQQN